MVCWLRYLQIIQGPRLSTDLHPDVGPLAWLLGTWVGLGVVGYPTMDGSLQVAQELTISHDGRPFLIHFSRTWEVNSKGEKIRPRAMESGFWRTHPVRQVELVLAHSTGVAETWHGEMDMIQFTNNDISQGFDQARIVMNNGNQFADQASLIHTKTAKPISGGVRTYVLPQPDILGWVYDMETSETPLTSHASFKLHKAGAQ